MTCWLGILLSVISHCLSTPFVILIPLWCIPDNPLRAGGVFPVWNILHKSLWAHNCNLIKIFYFYFYLIIRSGHNFVHVTTAQLPWHVQNCDLIWSLFFHVRAKYFSLQDFSDKLINHYWDKCLVLVVPVQLGQTPACDLTGPAIDLLMSPKFGWPPQAWYLLGAGCPGAISSSTCDKTQGPSMATSRDKGDN